MWALEWTPSDLEKIRIERLAGRLRRDDDDKDKKPRPVTPATVNREYAFLKHVFNIAIRDGKTERNPVAKLKMLREPSGRVRYMSDEEETVLFAKLLTDESRDRVRVLLQTGLRKSEFLGLRWKDVDLKAGVLTIPRSKHGETRRVPLTSEVRAIISRRPRSLDATALIFPNRLGNADLHWAEKDFPVAVEEAEIKDFRLHDTATPSPRAWRWKRWTSSRSRNSAGGRRSAWCSGTRICRPGISGRRSSGWLHDRWRRSRPKRERRSSTLI